MRALTTLIGGKHARNEQCKPFGNIKRVQAGEYLHRRWGSKDFARHYDVQHAFPNKSSMCRLVAGAAAREEDDFLAEFLPLQKKY